MDNNLIINEWESFYKEHLKIKVDFSKIFIPQKPIDNREYIPLFIAKGLNFLDVYDKFPFSKGKEQPFGLTPENLVNKRDNDHDYVVWVSCSNFINQIPANISTQDFDLNADDHMTLLEGSILEFKYFVDKGRNLIQERTETCYPGSRYGEYGVPRITHNTFFNAIIIGWVNPLMCTAHEACVHSVAI